MALSSGDNSMDCKTMFLCFILLAVFINPCQATTKCYKDICIGQEVRVIKGLYIGNTARILDILKERTPDSDEEAIRDFYKYFVSFSDGTVTELYRDEIKDN